jgi:hypothetical protein
MAIQIIDGFQVNTSSPIDNRIVASGSSARNNIPYKYEGMRVFDTSDNIPYVWVNNSWISENSTGVSGFGTASRIPLYTSSNVIANSLLYQSGNQILTDDSGSGPDKVSINTSTGLVTAVSFAGVGTQVTSILGSNIINGSIPVDGSNSKLINGSTGQILISGVSSTRWTSQNQLSVGTSSFSATSSFATTASNVNISTTTSNSNHYLAFAAGGSWLATPGSTNLLSDSSGIYYNPSSNLLGGIGSLLAATGSTNSPSISFTSDSNTGIYSPGADSISIITGGADKLSISSNSVVFGPRTNFHPIVRIGATSSATSPSFTWWGNDQTGIFRPDSNALAVSTGGVERARFSDSGASIVESVPGVSWTILNFMTDVWISNLASGVSPTAVDLPSTDYDRIIYANNTGLSGSSKISMHVETTTGFFISLASSGDGAGCMIILPAGKKWRCFLNALSGTSTVRFYIYKFGR